MCATAADETQKLNLILLSCTHGACNAAFREYLVAFGLKRVVDHAQELYAMMLFAEHVKDGQELMDLMQGVKWDDGDSNLKCNVIAMMNFLWTIKHRQPV